MVIKYQKISMKTKNTINIWQQSEGTSRSLRDDARRINSSNRMQNVIWSKYGCTCCQPHPLRSKRADDKLRSYEEMFQSEVLKSQIRFHTRGQKIGQIVSFLYSTMHQTDGAEKVLAPKVHAPFHTVQNSKHASPIALTSIKTEDDDKFPMVDDGSNPTR